jgi:predicted lipoprotein with Yx(FWY)xxD motif
MTHRKAIVAAGLLPLLLVLAACTTGGAASTPSAAAPSVATSPSAASVEPSASAEEPSASAAAEVELKVVDGGADLGMYLVGENDLTLYTFTNDTKDSGKSTCNGDCATAWPPLMAESEAAVAKGDGVTGTITIITRDDGGKQVAYNGMPLYYFQGDTAAGQTNGQGLNDKWFVAAP